MGMFEPSVAELLPNAPSVNCPPPASLHPEPLSQLISNNVNNVKSKDKHPCDTHPCNKLSCEPCSTQNINLVSPDTIFDENENPIPFLYPHHKQDSASSSDEYDSL